MGRHLPGLGRQDADPLEDLAWNFRGADGVALALELLRLRTADRLLTPGFEPMEWSALCRVSEEELPGRLDELADGRRTRSSFDFRRELSPSLREELSFTRRVVTDRGRSLLHAAVRWLERPAPLQDGALPYDLRPGRHMRELVERCFWRGYGMEGGFARLGSRGLPTPASLLTSRAYRGDRRMRDWVDCLLAAVVPIGVDASIYAPDCRDGHILLRALERLEAGFEVEPPHDGAPYMRCHGRCRRTVDFELAGLRTLLQGMSHTSIELVHDGAPTVGGPRFDVGLLNRLFDRRDRDAAGPGARRSASDSSPSRRELEDERAELLDDLLRRLSPNGIAAVAVPPEFGQHGSTQTQTGKLREVIVEAGVLRVVIELPAGAGLVLILEGPGRRDDSASESDVLFIRSPARWRRLSSMGTPPGSSARDPLAALVAVVEADRAGELPREARPGGAWAPGSGWVSRNQLREQGHELRPEALRRAGHEGAGLLTRPEVDKIREKLAKLEKLRGEVDGEMDTLLDDLAQLR